MTMWNNNPIAIDPPADPPMPLTPEPTPPDPTPPIEPLRPQREPVPGTPSITPEERPNDPGKPAEPTREHPHDPQPAQPMAMAFSRIC